MNGPNFVSVAVNEEVNTKAEIYKLELSPDTADKFASILSNEVLTHSGFVSHQANNGNKAESQAVSRKLPPLPLYLSGINA